jgi:hypothetical protein
VQWPTLAEWTEIIGNWNKLPATVGAIDGTGRLLKFIDPKPIPKNFIFQDTDISTQYTPRSLLITQGEFVTFSLDF